ncbi:MAG: DUF45 domain-containing protein [Acidisphaera sp.]|nr:DUF45 domain-containing protein [Acidisphaera sp.]
MASSWPHTPRPETLHLPRGPARVRWRRNARARRVSLRIDARGGGVVVTLPPLAGRRAGVALLISHAEWVSACLAALPGHIPFADGARIPLDGRDHRIRHVGDGAERAWLDDGEIRCSGPAEAVPRLVTDLLRTEARRRLAPLARRKARLAGLRPRRILVKDTHSRWGSCTADGTLAFCWRLLLAPGFVQDYVAAHEVAHLRHMDHGPGFWALVHRLSRHAGPAVAWLAREGPRLLRIG